MLNPLQVSAAGHANLVSGVIAAIVAEGKQLYTHSPQERSQLTSYTCFTDPVPDAGAQMLLIDFSGLLHLKKVFGKLSPMYAVLISDSLNTVDRFLPLVTHL